MKSMYLRNCTTGYSIDHNAEIPNVLVSPSIRIHSRFKVYLNGNNVYYISGLGLIRKLKKSVNILNNKL